MKIKIQGVISSWFKKSFIILLKFKFFTPCDAFHTFSHKKITNHIDMQIKWINSSLTSCISIADKREMNSTIIAISKYSWILFFHILRNIFLIYIINSCNTLYLWREKSINVSSYAIFSSASSYNMGDLWNLKFYEKNRILLYFQIPIGAKEKMQIKLHRGNFLHKSHPDNVHVYRWGLMKIYWNFSLYMWEV